MKTRKTRKTRTIITSLAAISMMAVTTLSAWGGHDETSPELQKEYGLKVLKIKHTKPHKTLPPRTAIYDQPVTVLTTEEYHAILECALNGGEIDECTQQVKGP